MKRSRFSEEQILKVLKEVKEGEKVRAVCGRHNISEGTYFTISSETNAPIENYSLFGNLREASVILEE